MLEFWDYVQAIVIIGAVILGAYYVTKLVGKTGGGTFRRNSGIKIIASQQLGKEKSVTIVEIGEYDYILGVSAQRVELLDKLLKTDLGLKKEEPVQQPPSFGVSFKEELNKRFMRHNKND